MKDNSREYHESFAHPALYTHPNPVNIAILGGGDGGILREALKYTSVETVTIIEIDPVVVDIAREHFPFLTDCSGLEGAPESCFDDARVTIEYADARDFIKSRYGAEKTMSPAIDNFDVVIVDVLSYKEDPVLYEDATFWDSLYHSLSADGVFGVALSESPSIHDPKQAYGKTAPRETFFNILENHEMTAHMFVYEEGHTGRPDPQSFMTVCKSAECKGRWLAEPDAVEFELSERLVRSTTDEDILYHYDGATQHSFQMPSKGWETNYCRREPMPFECDYRGLDLTKELYQLDFDDEDESDFDVEYLTIDGKEVVTFYAGEDIPAGSYIMPSELAASFDIKDASLKNLQANTKVAETGEVSVIGDFLKYIEKNGHRSLINGRDITVVEVGGSFLIRRSDDEKKVNVGRWMPNHPSGKIPVFSPVYDRRLESMDLFLVATKDIKQGDEIIKSISLW
jgi:spermidine synthase